MKKTLAARFCRIFIHAVILFPFFLAFGNSALADPLEENLGPELDKLREKFHAPALAAAAIRDGTVIAIGVSGVRDLEDKDKAVITDRSLIGSCGKAATRMLIGRLVEKGKLRWDSTLSELLPDVRMRDEYHSVTIGDVIGHQGGLQPYTMITPDRTPILFQQSGSPREQRAVFVAHLLMEPPSAPPKTKFVYSNAGYGLLGHIAERLADKSYEQLMRDEVFQPLGMSTAAIGAATSMPSMPGWIGHMRTPQGFKPVKPARSPLPPIAPAGMMSMSIEDFAKLGAALVNVEAGKPTEFLGKTAIEKLPELRPGAKSVEGEIFYGGDGHFTAAFALWPSRGLAIVVESNAGDCDALCGATVNAILAIVAPDVPAQTSLSNAAKPGDEKPKRYGFHIQAEGDDDTLLVVDVDADSVAAKAGLKQNDRITAINGAALSGLSPDERMSRIHRSPLKLRVERDGKPLEIEMRLP